MSLLNSLGLLLAKSTSFARYFLALSFALTAISIAACSGNNTTTTDTTAADKKKCEDDGGTWDDTKAAGKKCVKSDTTANGNDTGTEEDGGSEEAATETKVTFEFTFAAATNDGFTVEGVDLTAALDVDTTDDDNEVKDVTFKVSKDKDNDKKLTFTFTNTELDTDLKGLKSSDDNVQLKLTLGTDDTAKSVMLTGDVLKTFLGEAEGDVYDTFAGGNSNVASADKLTNLLAELDKLFAAKES